MTSIKEEPTMNKSKLESETLESLNNENAVQNLIFSHQMKFNEASQNEIIGFIVRNVKNVRKTDDWKFLKLYNDLEVKVYSARHAYIKAIDQMKWTIRITSKIRNMRMITRPTLNISLLKFFYVECIPCSSYCVSPDDVDFQINGRTIVDDTDMLVEAGIKDGCTVNAVFKSFDVIKAILEG